MSVTPKPLIDGKYAENAQTTQYTAPALTATTIDKFDARNDDTSAQTIAVNLVPSGGAASGANLRKSKTLGPGESYTFPEVVGHTLKAGDFISTIASVASKVSIMASGREIVS